MVRWLFGLVLSGLLSTVLYAHQLSGTIYGGKTPLAGATVSLFDSGTGSEIGSMTTGETGQYQFTVDDGDYNLKVYSNSPSFGNSLVNAVTIDGADVAFNVVLLPTDSRYTISGTVRDSQGNSVNTAQLEFHVSRGASVFANTDSAGNYSVVLDPDIYQLDIIVYSHPTMPNYVHIYNMIDSLIVNQSTTLDIVLPPVLTISGRTLRPDGSIAPDVHMAISDGWVSDGVGYTVTDRTDSDDQGHFELRVFAHDNFTVYTYPPADSGLIETRFEGVSVLVDTTQDFYIDADPRVTLSGILRDADGNPLPQSQIELRNNEHESFYTDTDNAGAYSVKLMPDTYDLGLNVYGQPGLPHYTSITGFVSELVMTEDRVLDLTLPPTQTLSGRTLDPHGATVAGVHLSIYAYWLDNGALINMSDRTDTDENGNYSLKVFANDAFTMVAYPPQGSGLIDTTFEGVSVLEDTVLDLTLDTDVRAIVSGIVRDALGNPVYPVQMEFTAGPGITEHADANQDGFYSLSLDHGSYDVSFQIYGTYVSHLPEFLTVQRHTSGLNIAGDLTYDIDLPGTVDLFGKTIDSNGVPTPGVNVNAWSAWLDGDTLWNNSSDRYSDAAGDYQIAMFPNDDYTFIITPPGGSGFLGTTIQGIDLSTSLQQNVVLAFGDTRPPTIISGPIISHITDRTALVSWQTDEPTTGVVAFGIASPSSLIPVDNLATSHSVSLTDLSPDTLYQVQVSASDTSGNGPTTSGIIEFRTLPAPDTDPPMIISGPGVVNITHNSATIIWETNEPGTSLVSYSASGGQTQEMGSEALTLYHELHLTGLDSETQYTFQVASSDAAGNGPVTSALDQFTTLAVPDTIPPTILSGPIVIDITHQSATILWTTDEPATSGVSYNDGTVYGVVSDAALVTEHRVFLTGLTPETLYNYTVSSSDAAGNGPTLSDEHQFTTSPEPDSRPPLIVMGPIVQGISQNHALIKWRTDESADSLVEYGLDPDHLDLSNGRPNLVTNHAISLFNLTPDTTYYFRVSSSDAAGNTVTSEVHDFTTRPGPDNEAPLFVTEPHLVGVSDTLLTLAWSTDEPTAARLLFGPTGNEFRADVTARNRQHQLTLTGLQPGETYQIDLMVSDAAGNTARYSSGAGKRAGFTTALEPDTTPPQLIVAPEIASLSHDMAVVRWQTDEYSDSRVTFGLDGGSLNLFAGTLSLVTDHRVPLTGLQAGTTYAFQVQSSDVLGNASAASTTVVFTTAATPDSTAPVLSDLLLADVSYEDAVLTWETDEFATVRLDYGTASDDLSLRWEDDEAGVSHTATLANLLADTTYFYRIRAVDIVGNVTESSIERFSTLTDTTCAVIVSDPADAQVCVGDSFSLEVATTGTGISFQWYRDDALLPDETGASLVFESFSSEDAGAYFCQVGGGCGTIVSQVATVTALTLPVIEGLSEGGAYCPGSSVILSLSASSTDSVSYSWHLNDVPLVDGEGTSYTISNFSPADVGAYTCLVSNSCGELLTSEIDLELAALVLSTPYGSAASGLDSIRLEAVLGCASGGATIEWFDTRTGTSFGLNQNPIVLETPPPETTVYEAEAFDPVTGWEVVGRAVILVSDNLQFLDYDGDGCNSIDDLHQLGALWPGPMENDADGDGLLTVLDTLYINTSESCDP